MADGVLGVERRERVDIRTIERLDSGADDVFGLELDGPPG